MIKNQLRPVGIALTALVVVFLSVSTLTDNLIGKTLAAAFLPGIEAEVEVAAKEESNLLKELRMHPTQLPLVDMTVVDEETLWLARCIYSETKSPVEQELVAWVVRNRVETGFRGATTYKGAVTAPYQFSAFNPESRVRRYYTSLTPESSAAGWKRALTIAHHVRFADESRRPFSDETRHFYSEQSMKGVKHPAWSAGNSPVRPHRPDSIKPERFRFYEQIR